MKIFFWAYESFKLIDILYPYDFDLLVIDSKDIFIRKEIVEAAIRDGICIKKS
jgi:hypothetical protein